MRLQEERPRMEELQNLEVQKQNSAQARGAEQVLGRNAVARNDSREPSLIKRTKDMDGPNDYGRCYGLKQ